MTDARPVYHPEELRGALECLGYSEATIWRELGRIAAEGRLVGPLFGAGEPKDAARTFEPQCLARGDVVAPPAERFLLGRMIPLAKSTVLFGPTGAGKSAWLAQLVFAVAGTESQLHGLEVGVHGPVLIVTAEDTTEDWCRKAAAINHATELEVLWASENIHVMDLTDGEARLSESVSMRDRETTRRVSRSTSLQDRIIERARGLGAVLVAVETASRLVEDEDNASFTALQSALGRIARKTGAAVVITHHATKAASKENDSSIENARGGGSLVYNARNAITLFPAEPSVAKPLADRFPAEDVFTLSHGKSTSSTRREDAITLVRVGSPHGAVFHLPEDVQADPQQAEALQARRGAARTLEVDRLRRLYQLAETALTTRPRLTASYLETRHADLGLARKEMRRLVETAVKEGVLKAGARVNSGVALVLGFDPNRPVREESDKAGEAGKETTT